MFSRTIRKLKTSLFLRLVVLYTLSFTILSALSFIVFYHRVYSLAIDRLDHELIEEAAGFGTLLREEGLTGVAAEIAEMAKTEKPSEEFHRLLSADGKNLAATDMSSWGGVERTGVPAELHGGAAKHVFQTVSVPQLDIKARMISAAIGPDAVIQIGETLEETEEYLGVFRTLFLLLIIVLVIASSGIGWYLARRALRDMESVTRTAEEIANGAYARRVSVRGQFQEIQRLGATFNKMLDRIQGLLESMKEINDNIAHDLRSPLARIRGIAEMTLLKADAVEDYREMAVSTMEECETLIGMINTMLDITEAEAGVNGIATEEVEMVALISEACELFRPIADEKAIGLKTDLPGALPWSSDKKKMQRIVTNLLENAIKYTPARGTVVVAAEVRNGELRLAVSDTGIGIAESDLARIFDRFYRCDRSRSVGGVGLGLSLVNAYTRSLNGTIRVESSPGRGSVFALRFPQCP
jgi:signal transduction histidine kinase